MRLRPTSDRVREAVFNIIAHGIPDFEMAGARVLDAFDWSTFNPAPGHLKATYFAVMA